MINPVYIHPTTGAPWFRCPRCSSDHVRPMRIDTCDFGMNVFIVNGENNGYVAIPGADRALRLEFGRSSSEAEILYWLSCGSCDHAFRADGQSLPIEEIEPVWHVVIDNSVLIPIGVTLHEAIDPETDACLYTLRHAECGEFVGTWIIELSLVTGPWLDEAFGDGSTGVHMHPVNVGTGNPSWLDEKRPDDAIWEGFMEGLPTQCVAYSFIADSLPTFLEPNEK